MAINFYNFNGNSSSHGSIDFLEQASDRDGDGLYDLTTNGNYHTGYMRIEFDAPADLSSWQGSGSSNLSVYDVVTIDSNSSTSSEESYFQSQYDYGGGSPPFSLSFYYAEDANGSIDRYGSGPGYTPDYSEVTALTYYVYTANVPEGYEGTISADFSNNTVFDTTFIGNYYSNGWEGEGYYTGDNSNNGNGGTVTGTGQYYGTGYGNSGELYRFFEYGPNGPGLYTHDSAGSTDYEYVGREPVSYTHLTLPTLYSV